MYPCPHRLESESCPQCLRERITELRAKLIDSSEQLEVSRDLHQRWMVVIAELAVKHGISSYDDRPGMWYEHVSARLDESDKLTHAVGVLRRDNARLVEHLHDREYKAANLEKTAELDQKIILAQAESYVSLESDLSGARREIETLRGALRIQDKGVK